MSLIESIKRIKVFSDLSDKDVGELTKEVEALRLKRGDFLYKMGDQAQFVYIVTVGSVKLVKYHPEGKERIVHFLLRGELFGAMVALNGGVYPLSALALEESTVLKIKADVFKQVYLNHPKIGQNLIEQISQRMMSAHDDRLFTIESVDKRIALFLVELLDRVQKIYGQTSRINLPLTKQDIADKVASTVETVIRIMGKWTKQKLVIVKDRYVEIPDVVQFKKNFDIETSL